MSTMTWMNKKDVVDPYRGILFGHTDEWNIDTSYDIEELRKYWHGKK